MESKGTIEQCDLGPHNHNIFRFSLPVESVVKEGLFVEGAGSLAVKLVLEKSVDSFVEGDFVVEGADLAGRLALEESEGIIEQCSLRHHNHNIFRFGLPVELVVKGDFVVEGADLAGRLAVVGAVEPGVKESAGLVG